MDKLSIVIVSLNNPKYFDLLMSGLVRNTRMPFEVLVHMNEPDDEFRSVFVDWYEQGIITQYSESFENTGVAENANKLFAKASGQYFAFLDDDVYPCPNWDTSLLRMAHPHIECQYLSPILFQPKEAGFPGAEKDYNLKSFGNDVDSFREYDFNRNWYMSRNILTDTQGIAGNFFMSAKLWNEIGGYDPSFLRGYDIDLKAKVWNWARTGHGGFEFRAVADSCLYHFAHVGHAKSVFGTHMSVGDRFQQKWGMTVGEFWLEATEGANG